MKAVKLYKVRPWIAANDTIINLQCTCKTCICSYTKFLMLKLIVNKKLGQLCKNNKVYASNAHFCLQTRLCISRPKDFRYRED